MFKCLINKIKEKKRRKEEEERQVAERRKNARMTATSMGISIWNAGPGKSYDGTYKFLRKEIDTGNNIITIYFAENEKLTIVNPLGVLWEGVLITVDDADKVIWEQYDYDKPQSEETFNRTEFVKIDRNHVKIIFTRYNNKKEEIISISNERAVETLQSPL